MSENDVKMPDLSGVFDMISKNPDMIRNAINAISAMSEVQSAEKGTEKDAGSPQGLPDPSVISSLLPMMAQNARSGSSGVRSDHRELLCALRPYLSSERRSVIDRLLEFGQIGELIKAFDRKKDSE